MRKQITITLDNIQKIKDFNEIVSSFQGEIELTNGKYIVDAKSIMGVLSLNLLVPVDVVLESEDDEELVKFESAMERFTDIKQKSENAKESFVTSFEKYIYEKFF